MRNARPLAACGGFAALVLAGVGLTAVGCGGDAPAPATPAPSSPSASLPSRDAGPSPNAALDAGSRDGGPREKFVVALVVDQLSAWVASSRFPALPPDGGFALLRREGTWVKHLRYPYSATETAQGHTALHTGATPSESAIFSHEFNDETGRRLSILDDANAKLVTSGGPLPGGVSQARCKAETVADRLRAARPESLVVSISVKDRSALLSAGRKPTHAVWYSPKADAFVTSTAIEPTLPAWVAGAGDNAAVLRARKTPWTLSDGDWIKKNTPLGDDEPGEGDLEGLGITFPHVAKTPQGFRASPQSDGVLVDLALAAIAAEYDPKKPTLLLVSFSASDVIGHALGPDSWEAWDQLYKLDAQIGRLVRGLEAKVGSVDVMLAADHGNVSMPESEKARALLPACSAEGKAKSLVDPFERPCNGGERLVPAALRDELEAALVKALGPQSGPSFGGEAAKWLADVNDPYVVLSPAGKALPAPRRAIADKTIRAVLGKHVGLAAVIDTALLRDKCADVLARGCKVPARALPNCEPETPGLPPSFPYVCRSYHPSVTGDFYMVPARGSFFSAEYVHLKGTSHGTPYLYDRTVPFLVRAKGRIDAGVEVEAPADFTAYSAVEAALLGLDPAPPAAALKAKIATPR